MKPSFAITASLLLLACGGAFAQSPGASAGGGVATPAQQKLLEMQKQKVNKALDDQQAAIAAMHRKLSGMDSPGMENMLDSGLSGRWWTNPYTAQLLELTPAQIKQMDDVFQQSRITLIDLTAALDKEEAILEPLVEADQPDAAKIRAQIDRIARARSELEKANANMLLGIRLVLTPAQWKNMRSRGPKPRAPLKYFR